MPPPAEPGAMGADLRAMGSVSRHPAGSALLVLPCAGGGCLGWLRWQGRGHEQQRRHPPAPAPRGEWHEVTEGPGGLPGLSQQGASPGGVCHPSSLKAVASLSKLSQQLCGKDFYFCLQNSAGISPGRQWILNL